MIQLDETQEYVSAILDPSTKLIMFFPYPVNSWNYCSSSW